MRKLERDYPNEPLYFVDLEGTETVLQAQLGLRRGVVVSVRIPWYETGRPNADGIPDTWHDWLGLTDSHRSTFPRGETLVYVRGERLTIERRQFDSGLGDTTLALAAPLGRAFGADHRLLAAVEAPTGDADQIGGSGGWDAALRWRSDWQWTTRSLAIGGGWAFLDGGGKFLGADRSDTWALFARFEQRFSERLSVAGEAHFESSPLNDFSESDPGEPAIYRTYELAYQLDGNLQLFIQYGQDKRGLGVSPDLGLRVGVAYSVTPPN